MQIRHSWVNNEIDFVIAQCFKMYCWDDIQIQINIFKSSHAKEEVQLKRFKTEY